MLLSAFLHASWNALLRVEPDKDRGLIAAITAASLFAGVIAAIRWSLGDVPFASEASVAATALAGAFEAIYFVTLARALEVGRLGPVYTVSRGGAMLVVWPMSMALYAEPATIASTAGSVLVLLGLVLSSLAARGIPVTKSHKAGIAWAAASAVSIAGYHLAYKAALREGGSPSATFAVSLGFAALLSVVRIGGAGRTKLGEVTRARFWRVVLMGIVCGGSFLILMEALAIGGSAYVLTLRNSSVLFAVGLAWLIGERPGRPELLGAALVVSGAVLMSLES
ncbi:MAG: EamA family transporter [Kofleriaceae bacterium]